MPLSMAKKGEQNQIKKITGKRNRSVSGISGLDDWKPVTVINELGGNVIINIKESRLAISKEMANRIMI
jgi:ferrous iron transport protein A